MLQIADITEYQVGDIPKLVNRIRPILEKRKKLHERYSRGATDKKLMYADDERLKITQLPFEKFITDLATGYTSGTPRYTVASCK